MTISIKDREVLKETIDKIFEHFFVKKKNVVFVIGLSDGGGFSLHPSYSICRELGRTALYRISYYKEGKSITIESPFIWNQKSSMTKFITAYIYEKSRATPEMY